MYNYNQFKSFADAIVGSSTHIEGFGFIYWCSVNNGTIRGYKDASGFKPWVVISRDKNKCIVRSADNKKEFEYECRFEDITRSTLSGIANRMHKL